MKDSAISMVVTFFLISVFILAFTNFVIMFPTEQGYTYEDRENDTYAVLEERDNKDIISSDLGGIENTTSTGYREWEPEVGFMGSNAQKVGESSISTYVTGVIDTLKIMAREVFSSRNGTHPVLILLGFFGTISTIYVTFKFIQFIRTGR